MKTTKRLLALLLTLTMVLGLVACGNSGKDSETESTGEQTTTAASGGTSDSVETIADLIEGLGYDDACDVIYDYNLSEFADYYATAKAELDDLDLRASLMALAEAKMLESGVFVPTIGDGGAYAMSCVAPKTGTTVGWGLDEYKFYSYRVANEIITAEDRAALNALWGEETDAEQWLADCDAYLAEHGYTQKDTWNYTIGYEQKTWDVIATSQQSNSYFIGCTYSGLLEYDTVGNQQPALATSYEVSDDGLTYTFHLREGVKWVDNQGREVGEVTADDWVASLQHLADNYGGLGYLMGSDGGCGIVNFDAFVNGECTWDDVGIEAVDDYTLVYTLETKFPAFVTMVGYGCMAPLNREFYKSQGGTFSAEGDDYTAGNYGTSPETIAYCGPYLCTNWTQTNVTTYEANPAFWNADAVNIKNINIYYNDGTDVTRTYNELKNGTSDACTINSSTLVLAKDETVEGSNASYFDTYAYVVQNSVTTYCSWLNLYRETWTNANDTTAGVSEQTEEQADRTFIAMNNQNFRLALAFAFDRGTWNAQSYGDDLAEVGLTNSYVPGNFYCLTADVTVDINGTSTTFPAGTYYGEIIQAQLDADGIPIQVWDPTGDDGIGSSFAFDGWYNVDNAVAYLEKAVEELSAQGVEVSAENPIYIDVPMYSASETNVNGRQVFKQNIESALGGAVIVNLVSFDDQSAYADAYYYTDYGYEMNYDFGLGVSGWGPDYGDPQTYLDTIQKYGYMCKSIGLY